MPDDRNIQECIVSSAANRHFYALKSEQCVEHDELLQNKSLVDEKQMQEYLKTAAANIDSADDLDNDPMSKFAKKYRINVVCLVLVSLGL